MSKELRRECPSCEVERTFWRTASTNLHLGKKVKWQCSECEFGFVTIDDTVDTGASPA